MRPELEHVQVRAQSQRQLCLAASRKVRVEVVRGRRGAGRWHFAIVAKADRDGLTPVGRVRLNLEMQVWPGTAAGVPRDRNRLAALHSVTNVHEHTIGLDMEIPACKAAR